MRVFRRTLIALLLTLAATVPARAQTWLSVEGGLAGAGIGFEEPLPQLGIRVAGVKPHAFNVDFSVALFPTVVAEGGLIAIPDLDIGYAVPAGDQVRIMARVGGSALADVVGEGGAGAIPGYNVGVGALARIGPRAAFRFDYTYRRLIEDGESYPVSSVSLGIAWTP
ncbi:MAG TPA: hypothetical protein VEK78_02140 [Gemmatimonadales bacterium]|nr:hypothetical protein [Gemmatimonadales bacterium]